MIRTSLAAASLALLMAMPASAQQDITQGGPCTPHGADQVRCALRIPVTGQYFYQMEFTGGGNGRVIGTLQTWMSECGLPGRAGRRMPVTNLRRYEIVALSTATSIGFACPEIFVFNCQENGQPVPCSKGFADAMISMVIRR